ncbi:MAG: hypothetical protein MI866_00800, partial [Bacteroidales bacterium]|nr:hypothetical protein [Bacteroidales bacterium]
MKKILLFFTIAVFTITFVGCVGDDIDDLQGQIDDLNNKVDELKETQDAALLAAIADMQAAIAALESNMDADYQDLLTDLTDLNEVVKNNKDAIFYGNLITDEEYDAFVAQGAEIVTGKVIVSKEDQVAKLANLIMVGDFLQIEGGMNVTIPMLETVASDVLINEVSEEGAVIELTKLASIGGELEIVYNNALTSVSAPALVMVYETLSMMDNPMLANVSMPALDVVGELDVNGGFQMYNAFDLSATDVIKDAFVYGILELPEVALGVVGGNITFADFEGVAGLSVANESITGDLTIEGMNGMEYINMPNLKKVEKDGWNGGNISVNSLYPPSDNNGGGGIFFSADQLKATSSADLLGWTNNIEVVEGNITLLGNKLTSVDAFNNVTTVDGSINFSGAGNLSSFYAFDAVTEVNGDITISVNADVVDGFNSLVNHNSGKIMMDANQIMEYSLNGTTWSGVCEVNGFASL